MNRRDLIKGAVGVAGALVVGTKLEAAEAAPYRGMWLVGDGGPELVQLPSRPELVYARTHKASSFPDEWANLTWSDGLRMYVDRPQGLYGFDFMWLNAPGTFVWYEGDDTFIIKTPMGDREFPLEQFGVAVPLNELRFNQVMDWYAQGAPNIG